MSDKIGRNDPCPCGSGRKYKKCHGQATESAPADDYAQAAPLALQWLEDRHGKAFKAEMQSLLFEQFWPIENPDPKEVPEDYWGMIGLNISEWLLASGELTIKGKRVSLPALVLGPGGPRLGPAQKAYLEQLSSTPLRLYYVTESRPGEGLTLVDALDQESEPLAVQERAGSQSLHAGDLLGTRVVRVGEHLQLSGALYPFTRWHAGPLLASIPDFLDSLEGLLEEEDSEAGREMERRELELAQYIVEHWFAQMTLPPPMPHMVDASTGQPIQLVTDHYRIVDRQALDSALAGAAELKQTDDHEWQYLDEDEHGTVRSRLSLTLPAPEKRRSDRLKLFCRTRQLADEGRAWFEALAGGSVHHLTREITDPAGAMAASGDPGSPLETMPPDSEHAPPDLPPEVISRLVAEAIQRSYADWTDEPIPALGHRMPRDAVTTPAGLERVKGLLRSYEEGEAQSAREQNREPVSFQFLWDELGISRN
jgi:hypothetical protein